MWLFECFERLITMCVLLGVRMLAWMMCRAFPLATIDLLVNSGQKRSLEKLAVLLRSEAIPCAEREQLSLLTYAAIAARHASYGSAEAILRLIAIQHPRQWKTVLQRLHAFDVCRDDQPTCEANIYKHIFGLWMNDPKINWSTLTAFAEEAHIEIAAHMCTSRVNIMISAEELGFYAIREAMRAASFCKNDALMPYCLDVGIRRGYIEETVVLARDFGLALPVPQLLQQANQLLYDAENPELAFQAAVAAGDPLSIETLEECARKYAIDGNDKAAVAALRLIAKTHRDAPTLQGE